MYALYSHPRRFKFKRKYQQYGPCFQTIFPFLMTKIKIKLQFPMAFYGKEKMKEINL